MMTAPPANDDATQQYTTHDLPIKMPAEIRTQRLHLVLAGAQFAEEQTKVVQKNQLYLHRFLTWATPDYSLEGALKKAEKDVKDWQEGSAADYVILHDGKLIGRIGFIWINHKYAEAEIGYWLAEDATGNGYMQECIYSLEKAGFKAGLHRININMASTNTPSFNAAKRAGYTFEGTARQNRILHGQRVDTHVFAKLVTD